MEGITDQHIQDMAKRFAEEATRMIYALQYASDEGAIKIQADALCDLGVVKKIADRHPQGQTLVSVFEKIAAGNYMEAHDDASFVAAVMQTS